MGLDASLYRSPKKYANVPFINPEDSFSDSEFEELHYWRQFWPLQYWMELLYSKKGGTKEFNCVNLQLTKEDLDQLEKDCKEFDTSQCLFGGRYAYELPLVIETARRVIDKGDCVFYWSWY